jgi:class 3 adenylate cyclase
MPDERKLVTILFADVTDSTALGDGLDPEDVRALMGRYYSHARRIVAAHGGTLEMMRSARWRQLWRCARP